MFYMKGYTIKKTEKFRTHTVILMPIIHTKNNSTELQLKGQQKNYNGIVENIQLTKKNGKEEPRNQEKKVEQTEKKQQHEKLKSNHLVTALNVNGINIPCKLKRRDSLTGKKKKPQLYVIHKKHNFQQ